MKAYNDIQDFFNQAYENFFSFENFQAEFCAIGELEKLSKVGKIIINLGEFCSITDIWWFRYFSKIQKTINNLSLFKILKFLIYSSEYITNL